MAYQEITAQKYPIELIRNDDWNKEIPVYADDAETIPFDFTGWAGKATVKINAKATSGVITFDTTAGTMALTSGKITLIAAKATTDIEPTSYVWDLEFTDADGKTRTLVKNSPFNILDDVT